MCIQTTQNKQELLKYFNISSTIADLLLVRNINTPYHVYSFFNPDIAMCYSPFLFDEMEDALNSIKYAINNNKTIGIFADSDIDGLTSLTVITHLFDLLGAKYCYRYPVGDELYGLTLSVIDEFKKQNVEYMITLDSGTRDINEIAYAKSNGIEVIVCDHHEPASQLPDAIIINPKRPGSQYPFKDLAGVGVTYKLCLALLLSYTKYYEKHIVTITSNNEMTYSIMHKGKIVTKGIINNNNELDEIIKQYNNAFIFAYDCHPTHNFSKSAMCYSIKDFYNELSPIHPIIKTDIKELFPCELDYANVLVQKIQLQQSKKIYQFIQDMLPMVAVGTVADMMPMVDENRILTKAGLEYFKTTNHCGIKVLREHIAKSINTDTIGWDISPLLNTPGRFGKTQLAADFLLGKNFSQAKDILNQIVQLNKERKNIIQYLVEKFYNHPQYSSSDTLTVIISDEIPDGLTGIIANRMADMSLQPVIVIADKSNADVVKGSGRSQNYFDFFSIVSQFSHLFEKLGGHNHAFGFSIKKENIHTLIKELQKCTPLITDKGTVRDYDYELPIETINFEFLDELTLFEPYGIGNKPFVFLSRHCAISNFYAINNRHYKLIINGSIPLEAMLWNISEEYKNIVTSNKPVDILYTVKTNEYNGLISPLLIIKDISLSDTK